MNDFLIENRPLMPGKFQSAYRITVSGGYFDTLHIPIASGRTFNSSDTFDAQPVAVVSRLFAERYFPGASPIGHRIQMHSSVNNPNLWVRIVGICADADYLWTDRQTEPAIYLNVAQMPVEETTYLLSTGGDPLALATSARRTLATLDSSVPLDAIETYQQYLNESFAGLSYVAAWLTVDAFVGLLLAAIGIFGVMANSVAERTREIGLRMAVGATQREVLSMILRRAAVLTTTGVIAGIILSIVMAHLSASLLFGVNPEDPVIFLTITAAVTAIALLVSWGPARRAAAIDPMRALRSE